MNRLNLKGTPVELFQELINQFNKMAISFPDFSDSKKLVIACDYSGEQKESNYFSVSFIVSDFDKLNDFDKGRLYVRDKYKIGKRRFEFKKIFHDKIITNGLTGFLRSVDTIPGILINFSINKEIEGLFENVDEIPYTLSGKKMEVPVKKALMGLDVSKHMNRDASRNPQAMDVFVELAGKI